MLRVVRLSMICIIFFITQCLIIYESIEVLRNQFCCMFDVTSDCAYVFCIDASLYKVDVPTIADMGWHGKSNIANGM